jgi:hypothetical protein
VDFEILEGALLVCAQVETHWENFREMLRYRTRVLINIEKENPIIADLAVEDYCINPPNLLHFVSDKKPALQRDYKDDLWADYVARYITVVLKRRIHNLRKQEYGQNKNSRSKLKPSTAKYRKRQGIPDDATKRSVVARDFLGISPKTLSRWEKKHSNYLRPIHKGRSVWYTPDDIDTAFKIKTGRFFFKKK